MGDLAEEFNAAHPVGTPVRFWPGVMTGPGIASRTRTPAWYVGPYPVVSVEGYAGGISLKHISPDVPDDAPSPVTPKTEPKAGN